MDISVYGYLKILDLKSFLMLLEITQQNPNIWKNNQSKLGSFDSDNLVNNESQK